MHGSYCDITQITVIIFMNCNLNIALQNCICNVVASPPELRIEHHHSKHRIVHCDIGWAKKSKILIWAFLFAGHLQNGVRDPPKKFQIYRPINDRWQAIFVLGSVLMGKRPKNGQKLTIFKNGLKTHPKVVNASNQR